MKHIVTTVTITDDLGGVGEATMLRFHAFGRVYEIDLNKRNQETFQRRQEALYAPYIAVARDVTEIEEKRAPIIRAWAAQNGIEVNARGRVPEDIIRQYEEAQAQEQGA
jgi:nucleoid-associated protein Lsr2